MSSALLDWTYFPTGEAGFFHTPVLVSGSTECVLIDGTFRISEARRITAEIARSGKRLTTIYVSCNDPDFYFGLKPLLDQFPAARLLAASATVAAIRANVDDKLAIWRDTLGDDGPAARAALTLPEPFDGDHLTVDGERIDIVTHAGMADRRTLFVPALNALFGGTMIVSGNHVWMADTPGHETIAAWIDALDGLLARAPAVVVPGHLAPGGPMGQDAIRFTRTYLLAFEEERARAADAAALIAAMTARYPDLAGATWLTLGAEVVMGERTWGSRDDGRPQAPPRYGVMPPARAAGEILAEGVTAAVMEAALDEMREALGGDWVFGPDHERLAAYNDAFPIDDIGRFAPAAAVAPDGVDQIRSVLAIANRRRIPLWTFSTGRNYAYGGAAPRVRGSIVLDLHRMNRILDVDEEAGTCLVEPGVTYFQLHAHLQLLGGKLWPSPPELGWASVVGNALEHGVGYTPMGDNFHFSCGMEVVLADGDVVRTGMGAMTGSNSWQLAKYSFGPFVDGLFTQSNFGVVTKLGMWLMPAPPAYRSYMFTFPRESDLARIIEIMRPLKLAQVIQNAGMVTPWTYEANLMAPRASFWDGEGRIPDHAKQGIIDRLDIGYWNLYASQYGPPALMDAQLAVIKDAFLQIEGARFFFAEQRPDLSGLKLREMVGRGEPNLMTLDVLNWVPDAGHIDFSPVSPSTGKDATALYELLKREVEGAGFDYIGAFIIGWRELHNIALIFYDRTDAEEQARARALFSRLVEQAKALGYGEYRTHLAFMDEVAATFDFNDGAMLRLNERIKDALDPNGILSAGKSGIWPKHLRAPAAAHSSS